MSMNLTLEVNGQDVELWQTPTYITYMCLMDADGKCSTKTGLLEAKRAIHCYIAWVESTTNGVWASSQEHEEARATVNRHVKEVLQELEVAKTIEVSLV